MTFLTLDTTTLDPTVVLYHSLASTSQFRRPIGIFPGPSKSGGQVRREARSGRAHLFAIFLQFAVKRALLVYRAPSCMSYIKGSRTNLGSQSASISTTVAGEGEFRTAYHGTYCGGQRNQQEAICKKFKPKYARMQNEYFAADFEVADKCIEIAEDWNRGCAPRREIQITRGDIQSTRDGTKYLVEPLIRYFTKFTSNNGWISTTGSADLKYMEAFAHYSYHRSGGQLLICDLQGRYRKDKWKAARCRFELTDPAICSRQRRYGPTDLGEKGIESFFANHVCNEFCSHFGQTKGKPWSRPKHPKQWFPLSEGTSMLSSLHTAQLSTKSRTTFTESMMMTLAEEDEEEESDSDSDDYYMY